MADPALVKQGERSRKKILRYVETYISRHGYPPTRREIAEKLGVSKTAVGFQLQQMAQDGVIEYDVGVARGIRVIATYL